ncbi:hypothetical protein [Bradyrhizobium cenepequi]
MYTLAAAQQEILVLEVSELDRVIADPAAAISFVSFENLLGRLDVIEPRLGPIVAAIEQGIGLDGKARHNAQQMFRLLETVPRDAIAPYPDRIEAIRFVCVQAGQITYLGANFIRCRFVCC